MPHTTKLIVTTTQGEGLTKFLSENPFWIGPAYCEKTSSPDHAKWDIVVMSDSFPPDNISPLPCPEPASVVIWLKHRSAGPDQREKQGEWIKKTFPGYQLKEIPFSHGPDNDRRYFDAIFALGNSYDAEVYREQRKQLSQRLLGQDLTEQALRESWRWVLVHELGPRKPLATALRNVADTISLDAVATGAQRTALAHAWMEVQGHLRAVPGVMVDPVMAGLSPLIAELDLWVQKACRGSIDLVHVANAGPDALAKIVRTLQEVEPSRR